jgi:hypothetical protein
MKRMENASVGERFAAFSSSMVQHGMEGILCIGNGIFSTGSFNGVGNANGFYCFWLLDTPVGRSAVLGWRVIWLWTMI